MMIYLYLYADCFVRAARGALKSPWTLALPVAYLAILLVAGILVAPLGIIGGFIVGIIMDLCASSFLYFIGQAVLGSPSRLNEMKKSFTEYFWPVISFGFVIWIASMMLGYALASNPQASKIEMGIWLIASVLLNAVPEVIYQKAHVGGIAIIVESARFIQEHWIEWLIPNFLLAAGVYGCVVALGMLPFGIFLMPPVIGAAIYFAFAFRGNLYHLLDTTSGFQLRVRYHGGVGLGR
jgi:hypothetical protein